jgi:hypothetical protein
MGVYRTIGMVFLRNAISNSGAEPQSVLVPQELLSPPDPLAKFESPCIAPAGRANKGRAAWSNDITELPTSESGCAQCTNGTMLVRRFSHKDRPLDPAKSWQHGAPCLKSAASVCGCAVPRQYVINDGSIFQFLDVFMISSSQ